VLVSPLETGRQDSDLEPLRLALRAMPPPAVDEASLRRMFRERREAARERGPARAASRRRWVLAAAVAGLAVGVASVLLVGERRQPPQGSAAVPAPVAVAAFQPLWSSPEVVPGAAYNVVRVRIPLSSLTLLPDSAPDGMIEADLLVGEDGLARGIRFNGPGALLVSKASQ
jgi:hypothetical protein